MSDDRLREREKSGGRQWLTASEGDSVCRQQGAGGERLWFLKDDTDE